MKKDEILEHWKHLEPNQPIKVTPVPYKHQGSTYAEDGIRITGTKEFIDSVLSCLKPLLAYEGVKTRLQVIYQESKDRETGSSLGSYNCYVQVHTRGQEAQMMGAFLEGIKGKKRERDKKRVKAPKKKVVNEN
jgi:hypothetical protein